MNDPAGNGTIIPIGLFGQLAFWAAAGLEIVASQDDQRSDSHSESASRPSGGAT
ncbi:hypothetical protein ACU4GD_37525 [Cupriavidus basilensis]